MTSQDDINGCQKSDFLFPVHGMSRKFYGRFMNLLTRRLKEEYFNIADCIRYKSKSTNWIVYSRPPAKGVNQVLEYIARYAYRVAITYSRILDVNGSNVSYDYKDYRKGGKHGVMTIEIDKFLTLLSMHVLTDRFVRIRHYGILSPCNREALRNVQQQLNVPPVPKERKKSYLEICNEKGWEIGVCRGCGYRRIIVSIINPAPRAPPFRTALMGN